RVRPRSRASHGAEGARRAGRAPAGRDRAQRDPLPRAAHRMERVGRDVDGRSSPRDRRHLSPTECAREVARELRRDARCDSIESMLRFHAIAVAPLITVLAGCHGSGGDGQQCTDCTPTGDMTFALPSPSGATLWTTTTMDKVLREAAPPAT